MLHFGMTSSPVRPGAIVVLDFGGQYAHLLARRVRECGAYAEIREPEISADDLREAAGIILSGGPQSVYDEAAPQGDPCLFDLDVPVLGICYGLQWMVKTLGGEVRGGAVKEYGKARVNMVSKLGASTFTAWMSHGDEVVRVPQGFACTATSDACVHAAVEDPVRQFFGVQFHPEVVHTEQGRDILKAFVGQCDTTPWSLEEFLPKIEKQIRDEVGDRSVFMLVSGGVDSTVAFALLNRVLGPGRVQGLLVDTGLMRQGEIAEVVSALSAIGFDNLMMEDASRIFFQKLKGIYDPEEKRKVIGDTFIEVQQQVSRTYNLSPATYLLGQGTIYPDTIESGGTKHADKIKTHHNRVALVEKMIEEGRVIEPLKDLYKDEVRMLGKAIGLPHELVWRHPFPGPGLGVRILCSPRSFVSHPTKGALPILMPHAVLPINSVGVQGDGRSYRKAVALFPGRSPLQYTEMHWKEFWELATEIPNRFTEVNRTVLSLSHQQPVSFFVSNFDVCRDRADLLREADVLVHQALRLGGLYEQLWQCPVVLLPMGTSAGGQSIVLRPVTSQEAMTAQATSFPNSVLMRIKDSLLRITGIDAVFLDLTSKPPGTIEWE